MSGPEADEFILKVQQAATGHPWYSHEKPKVNVKLWFIGLFEKWRSFDTRICQLMCAL